RDAGAAHRDSRLASPARDPCARADVSHTIDAAAAWIYRGVWASIVALFRVPPEPPTLPSSGEPVHSIRPSAGYLRYLKFLFWVAFLPGDVVPILLWLPIAIAFPIV